MKTTAPNWILKFYKDDPIKLQHEYTHASWIAGKTTREVSKAMRAIYDIPYMTAEELEIKKNRKPREPRQKVKCPHCETIGSIGGAMTRYHFGNCKSK